MIDRKQDFSMTLETLCEEFRQVNDVKAQKKRSKRKTRRQMKSNEVQNKTTEKIDEKQIVNDIKSDEIIIRHRTSSCCSCFCHYCDEQTINPKPLLVKSHSCPSSLLFTSEMMIESSSKSVPLSGSLETLFSSVSTRECVCHEKNLGRKIICLIKTKLFDLEKQQVLCDECPTSSSTSCIRCFSTRTDLGYSSGKYFEEFCYSHFFD